MCFMAALQKKGQSTFETPFYSGSQVNVLFVAQSANLRFCCISRWLHATVDPPRNQKQFAIKTLCVYTLFLIRDDDRQINKRSYEKSGVYCIWYNRWEFAGPTTRDENGTYKMCRHDAAQKRGFGVVPTKSLFTVMATIITATMRAAVFL